MKNISDGQIDFLLFLLINLPPLFWKNIQNQEGLCPLYVDTGCKYTIHIVMPTCRSADQSDRSSEGFCLCHDLHFTGVRFRGLGCGVCDRKVVGLNPRAGRVSVGALSEAIKSQ